jgi:hypothetical protein
VCELIPRLRLPSPRSPSPLPAPLALLRQRPQDLEVIDNALFPVWQVTQDVLLSVSGGKWLSWSKVACIRYCGFWQGAPLPVKAPRLRDFVFRQPIEPNAPVVDMT